MLSENQFNGLLMPVFSAFGWAGEEAAISFALTQMELFINYLYATLSRDIQTQFPFHGVDNASKTAFLAANETPENDIHIVFIARPMSLETSLALTDKSALAKGYKAADAQSDVLYQLLADLEPHWNLRVQQMEFDQEAGTATHYQDLFKDSIEKLDAETAADVFSRAAFLNSESQWIVPIYISQRTDSEKVAAMGTSIVSVTRDYLNALMPVTRFLTGQVRKKRARAKTPDKPRPKPKATPEETTIRQASDAAKLEQFVYISELKPLHIRRGFVNLTPIHWPFFAINARTVIRDVTVEYADRKDNKCAVWRLVPNDQARVVLSPKVQEWLEENFEPYDQIEVTASKPDSEQILIKLRSVG